MSLWEELKAECLACENCKLRAGSNCVVFGMGNPNAEVLFIGEAPGKNEDEQGLPFVGRSGKLLDEMLAKVALTREKNIFITNTVKCRPPENRNPMPEERRACAPWLKQQFKLLKPKIVVCLGRIAAQVIIEPKFAIMKEHGQWRKVDGIWYTATLHPAAILRNINQKVLSEADFTSLQKKIEEVCEHTYSLSKK